jgi:hypothetical protein
LERGSCFIAGFNSFSVRVYQIKENHKLESTIFSSLNIWPDFVVVRGER